MKEVVELTNYDMHRVIARARKEFGIIKRGTEEDYNPQLDYFEHKIYEVHTKIPISESELKEAIEIIIYDVKSILDDKCYSYNAIRTKEQIEFAKELQMLFNPFINEEIKINKLGNANLKDLFTLPVICLLRIYDSIDFWHSYYGIGGYYRMLEEFVLIHICIGKYPYALEDKYLD